MRAVYLVAVWLHILAAAVWVGGFVFIAAVAVPIARRQEFGAVRGPLIRLLGRRFRWVGWGSLLVMVATGLVTLAYRGVGPKELLSASFWTSPFGRTLALKLGLVALMLALTAIHDFVLGPHAAALTLGRPHAPETVRLRRRVTLLARLNLAVTLAVVAAGVLLVRGA